MTTCSKCSHLDDSHSPECPIGGDVKVTESKAVAEAATPVKSDLSEVELPKTLRHLAGTSQIWDDEDCFFASAESLRAGSICAVMAGEIARRWNRHKGLVEALKKIAEFDGESIWNDDRDDAANQMLDIAREALLTKLNSQGEA